MPSMANNTRSRVTDFGGGVALSTDESDRPSHPNLPQTLGNGTSGWGNIWNTTNSFGSGFGSTRRDSSRTRDNGYLDKSPDTIDGKTGSGSLVASSESDYWNMNRSPWGDANTTSISRVRSGVSPARKRSLVEANSSTYFPVHRTTALNQGPVTKPSKPSLDPTIGNFTSTRQSDSLSNGFSPFGGFGQADASSQRSDAGIGSWHDAVSVHSPSDDRRSVGASEYYGSAAPSRSGSLPPSRHGTESTQFSQAGDGYSRLAQPSRGPNASYSQTNGRYQERSGSMQSDSVSLYGRLSIDHDADPGMMIHNQSGSINGIPPAFTPSNPESNYSREIADLASSLVRTEDVQFANSGAFTPDVYTNGHLNDVAAQLRNFQLDTRSAPNGTAVRQSPFYSNTHTPQYDHLYPSRPDQSLSHGNFPIVERKLRGIQVQQDGRPYVNPQAYQSPNYQHIAAANSFRGPYTSYQYPLITGVQVNGVQSNVPMSNVPGIVPMLEPPKAPRQFDQPTGEKIMSVRLAEFKKNNKTTRKYELKDLFEYVVEFSGDQHGSRFIQQKLESANSDEKARLFEELEENALQLMYDVFGNYVIQKFFEHGDQNQKRMIADRMRCHVVSLSLNMYGCRVVQKALEHVLTDQQALLIKELESDVLRCVKDQNGNHVIQKAIERIPPKYIQFIIQAFEGHVGTLATHSYGCRVIQRMLEFCEDSAKASILQELHAEGPKLISDPFGNYVTQHIIEHGDDNDRVKLIEMVTAQLLTFSKHKFASNVVEKCLVFGNEAQRRAIMLKISTAKPEKGESAVTTLIKDSYGNYVIQKILETLNRNDYEDFVDILRPELEKAKKGITGKQLMSVEKKMHRFNRIDSVSGESSSRHSIGSTADGSAAPTPASTTNATSPQPNSLPSANTGATNESVQNNPLANNALNLSQTPVSITNIS